MTTYENLSDAEAAWDSESRQSPYSTLRCLRRRAHLRGLLSVSSPREDHRHTRTGVDPVRRLREQLQELRREIKAYETQKPANPARQAAWDDHLAKCRELLREETARLREMTNHPSE